MNSLDIIKIAKRDPVIRPYFGGVFPANLLMDIIPAYPSAIIANTDVDSRPGQHWVAFFFTSDCCGEFFDSYGHSPQYYHRSWLEWMKKNTVSWTFNQRSIQPSFSATCGIHSLFFLYHRCKGLSLDQVMKFYKRDKIYNDMMAEEDLESHIQEDIIIKDEDFVINQLCIAMK